MEDTDREPETIVADPSPVVGACFKAAAVLEAWKDGFAALESEVQPLIDRIVVGFLQQGLPDAATKLSGDWAATADAWQYHKRASSVAALMEKQEAERYQYQAAFVLRLRVLFLARRLREWATTAAGSKPSDPSDPDKPIRLLLFKQGHGRKTTDALVIVNGSAHDLQLRETQLNDLCALAKDGFRARRLSEKDGKRLRRLTGKLKDMGVGVQYERHETAHTVRLLGRITIHTCGDVADPAQELERICGELMRENFRRQRGP